MSTQTYSISDLSRELDITTRAIRFYEEQGLLSPERRGLERIYSARDKVSLKLILRGKRIGFSLAECRELIELYDPSSGNLKQLNSMLAKIRRAPRPAGTADARHPPDAAGAGHRPGALRTSPGRHPEQQRQPLNATGNPPCPCPNTSAWSK
ncbi:MerR family transcriptional regulator [Pseudomonas putida S11]|nr:MerR family transcriptional regulator [Pseudomonas putida S11]